MQKSSPQYRINYKNCQEKEHSEEKANLVCLKKQCIQNSLICSFCLEEGHRGHATKPLKHFLENLQKQYQKQSRENIDADLEKLEQSKLHLLCKIKEVVETLAQSFSELEDQVLSSYELIKHQILEKEAKRNRFQNFYHAMAHEGKGDPNFQIQNYLNFQPLSSFNLNNGLDAFVLDTKSSLEGIRKNLVTKVKGDHEFIVQQPVVNVIKQFSDDFIIPMTIKRTENVFSQYLVTSKQTVCYLSTFLKQLTGKLRIRVVNMDATGTLTIGIAKKQDIDSSKHVFPFTNHQKAFYLNSKGICQLQTINHIQSIKTGDVIDMMIKKNKCKFTRKKDVCNFQLSDKQASVFFFSLSGVCEIQITYPFKKQ